MEYHQLLILLCAALLGSDCLSSVSKMIGPRGGTVSVLCHYELRFRDSVKYWCKGYNPDNCEIIIQIGSASADGDRITISDDKTKGVFTVTMRNLTKSDGRYYSCGIQTEGQDPRFRLYLMVNTDIFGLSIKSDHNVFEGQEGGSVSVSCIYAEKYLDFSKYWCRGSDMDFCEILKMSNSSTLLDERISVTDDTTLQIFSVTMSRLRKTDSGWYWCGVDTAKVPMYISVAGAETSTPTTIKWIPTSEKTAEISSYTSRKRFSSTEAVTKKTFSQSQNNPTQVIIIVMSCLLSLLLVAAVIFIIKRNKKGNKLGEENHLSSLHFEKSTEDVQYAEVAFWKKEQRNMKPINNLDNDVIYSGIRS